MFFQSTAPLYPPGLDENGAVANFYPLKQPRQLKNSVPCIGFLYFRGTRQLSNQQIYIVHCGRQKFVHDIFMNKL